MDLPRSAQDYAYVTLASQPGAGEVVEASVDSGVTWTPVTVVNAEASILLRGPDYRDDEDGLLVPANATALWLRAKSGPQSIARVATMVFLY